MYKNLARVRIWKSKVKGQGHQRQKNEIVRHFVSLKCCKMTYFISALERPFVVSCVFGSFRCNEPHRQRVNTDPARQRHDHVGVRLDDHFPARGRYSRLESALGRLQGWVWSSRQQLLARPGEHAPSNQLAALPTEHGVRRPLIRCF